MAVSRRAAHVTGFGKVINETCRDPKIVQKLMYVFGVYCQCYRRDGFFTDM